MHYNKTFYIGKRPHRELESVGCAEDPLLRKHCEALPAPLQLGTPLGLAEWQRVEVMFDMISEIRCQRAGHNCMRTRATEGSDVDSFLSCMALERHADWIKKLHLTLFERLCT